MTIHTIHTGLELLAALAEYARSAISACTSAQTGAEFDVISVEVAFAATDDVDIVSRCEPPGEDHPSQREEWLNGLEFLALALKAAKTLPPDRCSWAAPLAGKLSALLAEREKYLVAQHHWWRQGALAEQRRQTLEAGLSPWCHIKDGSSTGELAAECTTAQATLVVKAWMHAELSARDSAAVRDWTSKETSWRNAYQAELSSRVTHTGIVNIPAALRFVPVLVVPLPHLGDGRRLECRAVASGVSLAWPGAELTVADWKDGGIEVQVGDEVAGHLQVRFERYEADLQVVSLAALSALAQVQDDPDFPEQTALAAGRTAMELLASETPWHTVLAEAAHDFDMRKTVESGAVLLIERALETRVYLETLLYRYLDAEFGNTVAELDKQLAKDKSAVLAVPAEHYYEIVALAEPDRGSWWAARLELDAGPGAFWLSETFP